jgi:hypothetical protein
LRRRGFRGVDETMSKMTQTISLENISGRQLIFHLPHEQFCGNGDCACEVREQMVQEYNHRTGEHTPHMAERRICSSISLLSGERRVVDPRVLNVPDISAAIGRSELVKL